jgi:hypothetical protein
MGNNILIFPAGMPKAVNYLEQNKFNCNIIGASSILNDPFMEKYPQWTYLPYVVAPEFNDALKEVINKFEINEIYTPNPVVWNHLKDNLQQLAPNVQLVNESPADVELYPYRTALKFSGTLVENFTNNSELSTKKKFSISGLQIATLFRHSETIPGMCDHEKLKGLIEIANSAPTGDIIEIGSWWGKSAFILLQLSRLNNIGNILCIDPWLNEHLVQGEKAVDLASAQFNADEAFEVFKMNLMPYTFGNFNYIRDTSLNGFNIYTKHTDIRTPEFGETRYEGGVSILHIDGNHSYEAVKSDLLTWKGVVKKDGWIVLDDYVWPFGDGPKKMGDEFLKSYKKNISYSFLRGSALFIKLSSAVDLFKK